MTSIPPAYNAGDTPPSYDEVVKKVDKLIGNSRSPREIISTVSQLSNEEISLLAERADRNPLKSDEHKRNFDLGVKKTITSQHEVPDDHLKEGASKAREASRKIDSAFESLVGRLAGIDNIYEPPGGGYSPKLKGFQEKTESIQESSLALEREFHNLTGDLQSFFHDFSSWAQPRVDELEKDIKKLKDKIEELKKEIEELNKALIGVLAGGIGGGFAIAIAGWWLGPIAVIGGLIVAGLSVFAALGIAIALGVKRDKLRDVEKSKEEKDKELKRITSAREQLEKLSNGTDSDIMEFRAGIQMISGVWQTALQDAREIKNYLDDADTDANQPTYMRQSLDEGVKIYNRMATYLYEYAKQV
ncbi:hypothetical protein AFLA70_5g008662 [Aspergillus flavus AF70]|nr:hypothetical protein AFLA70_5g008662 [Aspergillus flavus AF70]